MRIPLSIKITLVVIIAILLQTSVLLFNAYNDLIIDKKMQEKADVHLDISRLQQSLEFLWEKNEYEQIQAELSYMGPAHHIKKLLLLDESNIVLASSQLADINQDLNVVSPAEGSYNKLLPLFNRVRETHKSILQFYNNETVIIAIYPVDMGLSESEELIKRKTGIIYSEIDLLWISDYVRQTLQKKILPMIVLLGLIGALFVIAINRYLVKRIANINLAAEEFYSSGYKSRARVSGLDEISELANSFNVMAETVEKKSEELIRKEEDITLILDSMENGVISINEYGIIKTFNQSAEKMFGYKDGEVLGKNVKILMPEPFQREHDKHIQDFVHTGRAKIIGIGRDVPARHKDGHEFMMHLSVAEMPTAAGNERMFIGSCLDVTVQKQQELQLRHSQKMDALGKLTGGIAHDYNNMLGVILGYAELIKDELADHNPRLLKFVNEIHHAGSRGAKLTRKLLSFSRNKAAEESAVNINSVLNDNRHMLEKTLTVRIALEFDMENDLWPVFIDENDLEDAILNMCINAMHAMPDGGKISLSTSNRHLNEREAVELKLQGSGDYVCLKICDTGCGISEDIISKIFDPFFSTKEEKGNGLGLSQVYGFMTRSSGNVNVESELNRGTCFELYFPRYIEQQSAMSEKNMQYKLRKGTETILVVDDEPSLSELLDAMLTAQGYTVIPANSGDAALLVLENQSVDLVISDVLMPGMDGYQLAQKIRKKYPGMKIQLVSGFSDDLHKKNKDKELHKNLLHKPFDRQQLLFRVREMLDHEVEDVHW